MKQHMSNKWSVAFSHRNPLVPLLFILPALLFFSIFVLYPIISSFSLSFYKWNGISATKTFIGLDNYRDLFTDHHFFTSLRNNFFWLFCFLLAPWLGLGVALFLNQTVRGMRTYKTLFFMPFVISTVVTGLVFSWFYDPAGGILVTILGWFGIEPFSVLGKPLLANFGIIFAAMWPQIAYCMIIYLTGLTQVDKNVIEAAQMDGAKGFKMLYYVVLPQLKNATFITIVISVIGALRSFDMVQVMTDGGPFGSTEVLAHYMVKKSIFEFRMGYGAAIAVILFLIMLGYVLTVLNRLIKGVEE